jgi:hypothetical protein
MLNSTHAKFVLGCSVAAICLLAASSAMAQTCINFATASGQPMQVGGQNLSIDRNGNLVANGQVITRAQVASSEAGTLNLLGISGQLAASGPPMNAANAGGSGSTPSITTTEVSTDQALELMQRRRNQQATATMISGVALTVAVTASTAAPQPVPAPAVAQRLQRRVVKNAGPSKRFTLRRQAKRYGVAAAAPVDEKTAPQPKARQFARPYSERTIEAYGVPKPQAVLPYSYKDSPEPFVGATLADNGIWAEGYGEYEFHSNLNPGAINNPSRNQYTAGLMSGVDHTFRDADLLGAGTLQLGLLGGYNNTRSTFSNTPQGEGAKQRDDGGFVGAYGTYSLNSFALDFLVKGDFYNHHQAATCPTGSQPISTSGAQALRELQEAIGVLDQSGTNFAGARLSGPINASGDIAENNINVLSNVYYRFDIGDGYWLEPTTGFRYSYTDYGNNASLFGL